MEFPVFKCVIDESLESDLQVDFVALVDKPAIEKNFLAFNEAKLRFNVDQDKKIVSGPAMIADMLIYRNDPKLGEYYTVFDKNSILSIVQKFFKKGYVQNFNLMHDSEQKTSDITIYESYLVDRERGLNPMKGYEDAADGSWFISAKVEDENIWEGVKSGQYKGFSVEGIFRQVPVIVQKLNVAALLNTIKLNADDIDESVRVDMIKVLANAKAKS